MHGYSEGEGPAHGRQCVISRLRNFAAAAILFFFEDFTRLLRLKVFRMTLVEQLNMDEVME